MGWDYGKITQELISFSWRGLCFLMTRNFISLLFYLFNISFSYNILVVFN